MRELAAHRVNECNDGLRIEVVDEPGHGGACHHYRITVTGNPNVTSETDIHFQNGPIKEVGTNGLTHEALLAVLIDRLESFQLGPFACPENRKALGHLHSAMQALYEWTRARMARGVEGTHAK
jgi:hypothetical protein